MTCLSWLPTRWPTGSWPMTPSEKDHGRRSCHLDPSAWRQWVEEQRLAGLMRNDDTTLLLVTVAENDEREEDPCPGQG